MKADPQLVSRKKLYAKLANANLIRNRGPKNLVNIFDVRRARRNQDPSGNRTVHGDNSKYRVEKGPVPGWPPFFGVRGQAIAILANRHHHKGPAWTFHGRTYRQQKGDRSRL